MLKQWYNQITSDCKPGMTPVIFNKANGKDIIAIMPYPIWKTIRLPNTNEYNRLIINDSINPTVGLNDLQEAIAFDNYLHSIKETGQTYVIYYGLSTEPEPVILAFTWGDIWIRSIKAMSGSKIEPLQAIAN